MKVSSPKELGAIIKNKRLRNKMKMQDLVNINKSWNHQQLFDIEEEGKSTINTLFKLLEVLGLEIYATDKKDSSTEHL